jgi:lipopolysaccharide export system permease protein
VLHARQFDPLTETLLNVTLVDFTRDGTPNLRIRAASATLGEDAWRLTQAKAWTLQGADNPEAQAVIYPILNHPTTMTSDRLRDSLGSSEIISVYELPSMIQQLENAGFNTRQYQVWLQSELARPLFLVAMVLVGAAFTMRHARFGGTGVAALIAVLLGFAFYFVRNFSQILGEHGQVPVAFAVWAPPIASILLTVGILLHAEDG